MRAPAGCEWQYLVQDRRDGLCVEMFMLCLHAFVRFVSNLFALAYQHCTHTHTHTHTHTQYGPTQLCTACREALIIGVMGLFVFFLWRHPATHWACHTHNLKWLVAWNAAWADGAESGSRQLASCRTVSSHQTILTITSRLSRNFLYRFSPFHVWKVCDRSQNSWFLREPCQHRFATMSTIAGNSHNSPRDRGSKTNPD